MLDVAMSETGRRTAERMHEAPSTGIEIGNMERYSLKMQNTIREYLDSVDEEFLSYMERFREGKLAGYMKPVLFADVPQRLASEIADLLGLDVSGYKMGFQRDFLEHVEKRHGEHGEADRSMRDANDFARLPYILETYDAISRPINEDGNYVLSSKYKNSDGSLAPILLVEKRINGTYYSAFGRAELRQKNHLADQRLYWQKKRRGLSCACAQLSLPPDYTGQYRARICPLLQLL